MGGKENHLERKEKEVARLFSFEFVPVEGCKKAKTKKFIFFAKVGK